jgi:hypothetical protein
MILKNKNVRLLWVCQFVFAVSVAVISGWFALRAFNAAYYESTKCEAYADPEPETKDTRTDTCTKLYAIHADFQKAKDNTQSQIIATLKSADNVSLYSECTANDIDACKTACE